MKLRVGEPWMSGKDYGQSLRGLTVNILVKDKGHGLREVHLRDNDGYVWVPDVPI